MKNRIKKITALSILAFLVGGQFIVGPQASADSCANPAQVEFTFREANNRLAEDFTWELIKQERNADGGRYLGRVVKSGRITNEGSVRFEFNPLRYESQSGRGGTTAFAVRVYDIQREEGAHIFWDVIISCRSTVKKTFTLSVLTVVVRDARGMPITRHPFYIYKQAYGVNNTRIAGGLVSNRLNTGDSGQETVYLAPGEYVIKIPVPGNRGQLYEENNVVIRPETNNTFDYRSGNVRITILDGNGYGLENATVELYEQAYGAAGEPVVGKRLASARTSESGQVAFFHPAGTYALQVHGPQRSVYTYYNVTILSESNTLITKHVSTIRVFTRDENGILTRGIRVSLTEQLTNADGKRVAGKTLQHVGSNEIGEALFFVAPGTYAITSGSDTLYDIIVREGAMTDVTYRKRQSTKVGGGKSQDVVVKGIVFDALPSGSLVKTPYSPAVYFIEKGSLRLVPDEATFVALNFKWQDIHTISQDAFDAYPIAAPLPQIIGMHLPEGTLAKSDQATTVYLITEGKKRAFHDGYSFETLGYDWNKVIDVSTFVLDQYPTGDEIKVPVSVQTKLIKSADNAVVYRIEDGLKRPFASEAVFFAEGHDWDQVRIVPFEEIRAYPLGSLIQ